MTRIIQVGDWVQFPRGGVLVIGVVQHRVLDTYDSEPVTLFTTAGKCEVRDVVEVRSSEADHA